MIQALGSNERGWGDLNKEIPVVSFVKKILTLWQNNLECLLLAKELQPSLILVSLTLHRESI